MSVTFEETNHNTHVIHLNNEYEIKKELSNIKADKRAYDILAQKMIFIHIKLENVDTRAANILKQQVRAIGGEAVISKEAYAFTERKTDVLISASKETIKLLTKKIANLDYGLNKISKEIENTLFSNSGIMKIKDTVLDFRRKTYIMGILKFYKLFNPIHKNNEQILSKVESMVKAGVDMIDICEDNKLGLIDSKEDNLNKITQLIPLIRDIKNEFPNIILSIDTSKLDIAKESIEAGIDMVIEAIPLKYNEQMLHLVAKNRCPIVLMHRNSFLKKTPKPLKSISDVIREIQSNMSFALGQGIQKEKIIIEPGIGFGRSNQDNYLILRQLSSFKYLNVPILVELPKRSFLGEALRGRMEKTLISSIAANTMAIINGANIIKVDDVEQAVTMVNIVDAIRNIDEEN